MSACPYKYALGVPGEGVHARRIFGLAMNDIIGTILIAVITSWISGVGFFYSFAIWFILGEILHYIFGTPTAFLKMIGMTRDC